MVFPEIFQRNKSALFRVVFPPGAVASRVSRLAPQHLLCQERVNRCSIFFQNVVFSAWIRVIRYLQSISILGMPLGDCGKFVCRERVEPIVMDAGRQLQRQRFVDGEADWRSNDYKIGGISIARSLTENRGKARETRLRAFPSFTGCSTNVP